ncbi:Smr/MutS family protein [bacterium]|jgi:DNA-nicking Smr family endonuclease|nr:Smr/MutS family protein [bacterium]MBT7310302.1 Smr/MutS family protein [bacterium]
MGKSKKRSGGKRGKGMRNTIRSPGEQQSRNELPYFIDLHGEFRNDALVKLTREIAVFRKQGIREVEIIHGRGMHSENEPVLKTMTQEWIKDNPDKIASHRPVPKNEGSTIVVLKKVEE